MAQSVNSERGLRCSDSPSEAPCGLPCSLARSPHSRCRPCASFRFIILINSPNFEIYSVSSSMGPGARDKTCHFETAVHADSRHSEGHFGSGKILGRMRLRPMARFPGPQVFKHFSTCSEAVNATLATQMSSVGVSTSSILSTRRAPAGCRITGARGDISRRT